MARVFYIDGACSGNPGPGGFGVVELYINYSQTYTDLIPRGSINYKYYEFNMDTTNNRMELEALYHVLKYTKDSSDVIYISSDSAYVVNIVNDWMWKWVKNGWTRKGNKPIENLDIIKEIYNLISENPFKYEISKCKGHSNVLGNELADAIASNNINKYNKLKKEYHILDN